MSKIDLTISDLVADVKPVRFALGPLPAFLIWGAITLAASLLILSFSSLRPDLMAKLQSPLFLGEVADLFLLILSAAIAAVWLCFPDLRQNRRVLFLPIPFLIIYAALTIYRFGQPELTAGLDQQNSGWDCILCITLYSLVPGFWMFHTLRRHATTYPRLAGALSLLTAASIGLLVLKFVESNDSVSHLMLWHILPVAVFGVIGAVLGKKYLKW